ncbi:non-ribosomal peptide synthetase [Photorhabdus khanii]|uniref:Non-ribosomal peptide synthetase n=1 Tax=Photorhabdus khanii subsp. guanajuatensis TaxID=2100166 RepID=A0A4R4JR59_9GAMM|nr:non-ribosomal peptide synthetase [Photorhabdus khanii]TDB56913.1 non-ribosomal peptide synthetase [Photorhabdus khanii subsp. guanajuatensis]
MKDSIAQAGSALNAELFSQTSENIISANDASSQTKNTQNILKALTPGELFWYERFAALQPLQLPFETVGEQAKPRWTMSLWQSPLPGNGEEDPLRALLQTFVIYLARLTQQTEFQIGWCVDKVNGKSADLVPMVVEVEFDKPWRAVADWIDNELVQLMRHQTLSDDLLIRFPSLQAIPALTTCWPWQIAVSVIQDDEPCDQKISGELLTLQVNAQGSFRWIYDANRLSGEVVQRMGEHLQVLASSKKRGDEIPVGQLNVLPEAERTLLLETWNATEAPYPDPLCIHQLFEQQVEQAPHATALEYQEQTLSYAELNTRANRLAHQLMALGVTPDRRVAICVERSPMMVVTLLAVLKAGGAYVPLDSTYPRERLAYILSDSAPSVVLVDEAGRAALGKQALVGMTVLDTNIQFDQPDSNPQIPALTPQHLAYVIYTSGSTGQPKGVMVEHQAIYQRYLGFNDTYAVTEQDRVLQFAAFAFDVSVEDFFSSLCNGAALVLRDDSWLASMAEFIVLTRQYRITVMSLPTLFWSELAARNTGLPLPDCLRLIITGGEAIKKSAVQDWFRQEGHRPRLLNGYGPTENVVTVTYKDVLSPEDAHSIGRPAKNARIYLLDQYGQPVPLGCVGEMYIGGVGVARGYLNRPELSAERFIPDPFSPVAGARMYRSGDLARYLPGGDLEFLGRNDEQVKIRGFRIELGEIETRLLEHPAVQEAAVLARDGGQGKRLVAYVAAAANERLASDLREYLSAILPDYMVPSAFVRLETFPQTPNGKLDRRALPAPGEDDFVRQIYEAPQGEAEIAIAALWRELLGIEHISRHDSFFALGGHSLLGVQMIERLRSLGLTLAARDLFQSPVLSDLAQTLGRHQAVIVPPNIITPATTALTPAMLPLIDLTQPDIDHIVGQVPGGIANIQDIYALSPLQDGILFHHLLENEGDPYLVLYPVSFANRTLLDRYLAAMQQVVDRHDILRTAFLWQGLSGPAQVVWRQATLPVTELTLDPADGPVIDQLTQRFDPGRYRLDLNQAPLLHFVIAQETDGRWFLLELQHHLIGDHETMEVMKHEVQAYFAGQGDSLPAPVPFRNLVAEARLGVSQASHTRFFTDMLAEVDEPTLPFGLAEVHRDGSQEVEFYRMLPSGLNDRLRHQARCLGVSLAALCHLAWAQVVSRTSGQEKVVFGTVLFGRMGAGEGAGNGMGLFINTLPLRLDIDESPVRDSVQAVHLRLAGLLAHEHASLALAQRCSGVASGTPLFSALLNYRHNEQPDPLDETMAGIEFLGEQERTNYPFGLSVEDGGTTLGLTANVVQPFDPERLCDYMQQALESLVEALEQAPETPVRALNMLPEAERTLLMETWNATETSYPEALCIHQLFEQQAEQIPQATALVYQEQAISYAELNARANRLAHQLMALGVVPDQPVAICVARSPAMVVALLAVLKAGGAYVPLDSTYPGERLVYILNDTAPSVVLADATGWSVLGKEALAGLTVLDPNMLPDQPDSNPKVPALTPEHLAYVIYTSGSTGQPKGVMVEHQAIYQRYLGFNDTYAVTAQDRVLQFAAFAFDVSVEDFFSSLCNGATLVMRDDSWLASVAEFIALTRQQGITVMSLPTLFWSELAARDSGLPLPDCLRLIIIGGEAVKKNAIQDWFRQEGHRPRLLNGYGPTENVVTVTYKDVLSLEDARSIGRPAKNARIYLLDKYGQPVPAGCVGEMYIGGVGVARGYLNQPELSRERFMPDPFSPVSGARMYRTGDLARYLSDGDLEFLGRNDQQVKIRGFRVELGEIETRLVEHPAVQEAAVLALDDGRGKRLVAYVAAEEQTGLTALLREHLSAVLPDYMVPAAFVRLVSFPQTPNGKLDRRALPAPGEEAFARQVYEAPQGEAEIALAAIWRELLGIEQVSRHDSFFALGGHSLLAVRMIERLRHQGLTLAARDLFQSPVLSALAQTLGRHRAVRVPANVITPATTALTPAMLPLIDLTQAEIDHIVGQVPGGVANIQDIYALSPLQDGILFHYLLEQKGDPYLLLYPVVFANRALLDRYLAAVQQVVDRHDILRTSFIWQGLSVPAQVVWRQAQLPVTELTLDPVDGPVIDQLTRRFDPGHHRLDLSQAPLMHFVIAQETDGRWFLLELQHHLIGDHETMEVMNREVQAYLTGQEERLPVPAPFRNLVAQARLGVSQEEHTCFFTEMLAAVDEPTLPFGLTEVHYDGSQVTESHRMLTGTLNDRLRRQARYLGVSLASLCHLAWAQVLSCTSGQENVVFGTVLFGRMQMGDGADSGMGLFINTLPLRLDMDDTPVQDSVHAAHTRLAGLLSHEHASLALAQRCSGVQGDIPLFSALLNYRHNTLPATSNELISGIEFIDGQERTNYPFVLSVEDFGESLGLTAQVVQPFAPEKICGYMQQALESLVEALEQAPEMPVRALEILPEAERTLLLETWNKTETAYPGELCIHQLFEQQVEKTPEAIALVVGDQTLSYAELNARANRLARQLIEQGVCLNEHVATLLARSRELVVAQLAILKVGAVYVPIDPSVPDERRNWLINDCSAKLLIIDAQSDTPVGLSVPLFCLSDENNTSREEDRINPDLRRSSTGSAYIMYTSGSTGMPKGVVVPHRAVVRLVINNGYAEIGPDDRVAFTANPAFDASTFEVWAPLLNGGALVVIDHATLLTPQEFVLALQAHHITVLWLTIGLFNRLAAELSPVFPQIKILIFGGDIPDLQVIAQVLDNRPPQQLLQAYGPSEGTTFATIYPITAIPQGVSRIPIGRPIANTRVYLLDAYEQPVPLGVIGEIYVGGDGVAQGYFNRPELTAERFLIDPFSDNPDARMYRTGDLARYLPDGNLEFLGRNDQQVKIRGFRIELGEIEARLAEYPAVREVAVLALGDGQDKRLVAYVVAPADEGLAVSLRAHLSPILPDYMVPSAFVRLEALPLTPNGKLDRRALPVPDGEAVARQVYEAPQGETEIALAAVWRELLGIEQISRHDSFFALGGHSLLAVRMIERLRHQELTLTARDLFQSPVLSALAQTLGRHHAVRVPANVITPATTTLIPAMLPLIDLTQSDIDRIVEQVPGGMTNIQDIYALSPLQDGILFHHLLANEGDPYLLVDLMAFANRPLLDRYLAAVQQMVDRHDILRTAFIWKGLSVPAQVVWRQAPLSVIELTLDPADGPVGDQLVQRFDPRHYRIDLGQAPLLRFVVAQENDGRWFLLELQHHLIGDHTTLDVMNREVQAYLTAQEDSLPAPVPFRNLVAQARLGISQEEHTRFFTDMLAEVDEPTLPFGLADVHHDGSQETVSHRMLTTRLNNRLRYQARHLGVSLAALCHLAWAQVLSRTSGQEKVVFGTVLFGRMTAGEGADNGMGLFINTLPLRLDIDETPVQDSVRAAHLRLAGLLAHEHASLVLAQQCSGVANGTPLFSALLNYRHNDPLDPLNETMDGIEFLGGQESTNYPFVLSVEDGGTTLGLTAQVVQPFDPDRICGYMQQALESLVEALEQSPETPVRVLNILPETERTLLLKTWNATQSPYPDALCIHQLFEQQAERTPQATALVYQEQTLSYAELNARANRLAHQLIALGVVPDQWVAICVARSPAMVVGLLAVLKAGGAYVPLDPTYPGERLAYILTDAAPAILLADKAGRAALGEKALAELTVLDPNALLHPQDDNPQIPALTSRHLAYVIYTSGSTGTPKGAMLEHCGVCNYLLWARSDYLAERPFDSIISSPLAFDATVTSLYLPLLCGGKIRLLRDGQELIELLPALLSMESGALVKITPSHLSAMGQELKTVGQKCPAHCFVVGGETLPSSTVALWQTLSPGSRIINEYGPTETVVGCTVFDVNHPSRFVDNVPIGRPISNTQLYILDPHGEPVPMGVAGELYIGGVAVARGYLNRPELTAERFLSDPFSDRSDARVYRTGDLVRYLPDGNLVFIGRNDQQVKIRGFRIEPGEIEARLTEYPSVRESLVVTYGKGEDKHLVAYIVADAEEKLAQHLRSYLSALLPEYMIPSAFVRLDVLPLTPNGKLDRRALPVPDNEAFARQVYEAPQGEAEIALAAIWCEVLGIEQISRHDSFFALGGHSLLAVRMMNRIAVLGIELPLSTLFEAPTLIAFAEIMGARFDAQRRILPAIMPISREGELPLSFAQQRLWLLAQFQGVSDIYHIPMALRLCGQLDIVAWQQALDTLFARHEALRSVFVSVSVDGQPQVQLLSADRGLPLSQYDLRGIPDAEIRLEHLSIGEASTSFDLSHGPLIRACLIRLTDDEYRFLLTQHHIVSDGWSVGVLISELNTLYTAFLAGQPDPLPPLAIQYPDYAAWQRQWLSAEQVQTQSDYWRTLLADAPVLLDLPTDRPRPLEQSFAGDVMLIDLDAELTTSLKQLSEQQGVTLFMTLLSAWATVLSRLSGQEDLVIGTPSAGRSHQEVEPLIGFFVNTLALRIDLSGAPNVIELLARVRQTALAAQAHQDLPFEQVVEIVQPPRRLAHTPLFQVMFAWHNNEDPEWELPGLAVSLVDPVFDAVKFDLELELTEENGRIVGALSYATALFDQPTIERYVGYLHTVLQTMVAHPQQPVGEIDILAPAERRLLLETWNATEHTYPEQLCIHQLFEQQVQRTPNATALVCGAETLSYAELNRRANRLAHELIAQGVIPAQRVALCVSRSASMMIGLLAILKAGGAYVPLDPAYSGDRLSGILSDATPVMVVADAMGRTALGQDALKGLTVLEPDTDWGQPDSNPQVLSLHSRQLAYVIYTSGTTGVPKGVMVEHRGVINLAIDHIERLGVKPDSRVSQFASMSFDASVADIVMAYGAGAALHILSDDIRYDRQALWHYLDEQRITHLTLPPAVLQNAHELPPLQTHLTLILAGEALGSALLQSLAGRYNTFNIYGPTEATVAVMAWHCPADYHGEEIPIGRPINNTRIYLLDARGQPVPRGAVGELYLGGVGVARGYLNRPDLTAERFLDDPFSAIPGARMYRTGDLARYLSDGNLIYVGRNDQQVKIRGFRIEPGEIEARLMEYPSVRESLVITDGKGEDKRLVAYVVAEAEEELAQHLRSHLSARLPEYMIPSAFVRLDAFPLTRNAKLDRRALPAPDEKAVARQVYAAPRGETEIALADIWRELLGIEQISRHDNFFALGGHSLLAIRMVNLVAGQGLICTLNALFQFPVLSELAAKITSDLLSQPQTSAIPVRPGGTELPLFFVPSGMEDYSYVYGLAQHIRSDYPVYTLPWPSISEEPMSTMEEQAVRMINLMKAVQPTGPYRIAGYSSGGILAYAVAQWLLHAGETVNFLGLIDTPAPYDISEEPVQLNHLFLDALAKQLEEEHTEEVATLYRRIDQLNLVQFIEAAQELALYPASLRPDLVAKRWEQGEQYIQIVKEYEPQALAVTLHQFYAMEPSPPNPFVANEEPKPLTTDPSLGWGRIMPDALLQLIAVPGNHESLMENNEHRIALAQALNRALAMYCDEEALQY